MPTEPEQNFGAPRSKRSRTRPKPDNDGFVVFEVDGFAQLTPEQRTWPVVTPEQMIRQGAPQTPPKVDTPAASGDQPPPGLLPAPVVGVRSGFLGGTGL